MEVAALSGAALAKRLARQAGLKPVSPHDLRWSLVSTALGVGADLAPVQLIVGHASPTTTTRYDQCPDEAKGTTAQLAHVPWGVRMRACTVRGRRRNYYARELCRTPSSWSGREAQTHGPDSSRTIRGTGTTGRSAGRLERVERLPSGQGAKAGGHALRSEARDAGAYGKG